MANCCEKIKSFQKESGGSFAYIAKFREYGIKYLDGGSSFQEILFCPFCGSELEPSLRDEWFDELEKLDIDSDDEIPEVFQTDKWWKEK